MHNTATSIILNFIHGISKNKIRLTIFQKAEDDLNLDNSPFNVKIDNRTFFTWPTFFVYL